VCVCATYFQMLFFPTPAKSSQHANKMNLLKREKLPADGCVSMMSDRFVGKCTLFIL